MKERIQQLFSNVRSRGTKTYQYIVTDIRRRPLFNFFLALIILFLLIWANNLLTQKKAAENTTTPKKVVQTFGVGKTSTITVQGTVDKSGIIKIVSQGPGIVQKVNITEGDSVKKGSVLTNLSSNYQGDSAPGVQASIAYKQYKNTLDTYPIQLDLVNRQRDIATASAQNTEELRKITEQSKGDTQSIIDINNTLLNGLNQQLEILKSQGLPDTDSQVAALLAQKLPLQSALSQLNQAQRQVNYQTNTTNPPTTLANLQKDIALKQLDLQEKGLQLGKDIARLQSSLAAIGASVMNPASPVIGTVQKVNVTIGDSLTPGSVIATIVSKTAETSVNVSLPKDIASTISKVKPSTLRIDGKTYETLPRFVSDEAVEGTLYNAIYSLPANFSKHLTDGESIAIQIPIEKQQSNDTPFVPLDSVYQTVDSAYVYIIQQGKAVSRKVELGQVYGQYVEVKKGLTDGDKVILSRTVINGDEIQSN